MNQYTDESEFSFIEIANYTYSHRLAIVCCALALATIVGTWNFFFKRPVYKTMTPISVDLKNSSPFGAAAFNNPWVSDQKVKKKIHLTRSFFRSQEYQNALLNEIFGKTNVIEKTPEVLEYLKIIRVQLGQQKAQSIDDALSMTYGTLSLLTQEDTNTLNVVSTAHRAELAMAMANLGALLLVQYNHKHLIKEITSIESFITTQTKTVKSKLNDLEHQLTDLQKKSQLLSVASYQASMDKANLSRQSEFESLEIKVATGHFFIHEIENSIKNYKTTIKKTNHQSHLAIRQIQRKIDLLKYQQSINQKPFKKRSPAQQRQQQNAITQNFEKMDQIFKKQNKVWSSLSPWEYLKNLEKQLNEARQEHQKNISNLEAMKKSMHSSKKNFHKIPDTVRRISQLNRDIKITSHLYSELKSRLQEIQIQIAGKANDLVIILKAQVPRSAMGLSAPKKYLLAFLGGGVLCVLFLILRYLIIPTVRSSSDLRRVGMKSIGEISYWRAPKKMNRQNREFPLLLDINPLSLESNAIRHIRFNLQQEINNYKQQQSHDNAFIIALCSANSSEGKSFIASNIADSFSKAQLRTAIIDMDTVKPTIHNFFFSSSTNEDNDLESVEVSDLYFEKRSANEFLDIIEIKVHCQSAIDILDSHYLPDYLNTLRNQYDVIFIDTAPLRNSLEGLVASRNSDAVIFVADQRVSLRHDVFKSFEALKGSFSGNVFSILNFCYDEFSKNNRRAS